MPYSGLFTSLEGAALKTVLPRVRTAIAEMAG